MKVAFRQEYVEMLLKNKWAMDVVYCCKRLFSTLTTLHIHFKAIEKDVVCP